MFLCFSWKILRPAEAQKLLPSASQLSLTFSVLLKKNIAAYKCSMLSFVLAQRSAGMQFSESFSMGCTHKRSHTRTHTCTHAYACTRTKGTYTTWTVHVSKTKTKKHTHTDQTKSKRLIYTCNSMATTHQLQKKYY